MWVLWGFGVVPVGLSGVLGVLLGSEGSYGRGGIGPFWFWWGLGGFWWVLVGPGGVYWGLGGDMGGGGDCSGFWWSLEGFWGVLVGVLIGPWGF